MVEIFRHTDVARGVAIDDTFFKVEGFDNFLAGWKAQQVLVKNLPLS